MQAIFTKFLIPRVSKWRTKSFAKSIGLLVKVRWVWANDGLIPFYQDFRPETLISNQEMIEDIYA